jgi:uncharacterized protein YhhL (DUF1145 family)
MHWYLYVLFFVKLLVLYLFLKKRVDPTPESEKRFASVDKLFMILLAILILYLFHPYTKNPVCVDRETKLFLFVFGIMTLIHSV